MIWGTRLCRYYSSVSQLVKMHSLNQDVNDSLKENTYFSSSHYLAATTFSKD